jgi:hypothetical protein
MMAFSSTLRKIGSSKLSDPVVSLILSCSESLEAFLDNLPNLFSTTETVEAAIGGPLKASIAALVSPQFLRLKNP